MIYLLQDNTTLNQPKAHFASEWAAKAADRISLQIPVQVQEHMTHQHLRTTLHSLALGSLQEWKSRRNLTMISCIISQHQYRLLQGTSLNNFLNGYIKNNDNVKPCVQLVERFLLELQKYTRSVSLSAFQIYLRYPLARTSPARIWLPRGTGKRICPRYVCRCRDRAQAVCNFCSTYL